MKYRIYESQKDEKSVSRIIRECGWPDPEKNKKTLKAFRGFANSGSIYVAECEGSAESAVTTHSSTIRMLETNLRLCAVTSVCVSYLLRKSGVAGELTALALREAAANNEAVAALGIFDQGFYNKLGFGSFPYRYSISVDPLTLNVPRLERRPVRLGKKDLTRIFDNFSSRRVNHGQVHIPHPEFYYSFMVESENGFGLGFENNKGKITHHLWIKPEDESENGPYEVWWMVYNDLNGFMELLSLMKSLADQINTFKFTQPPGLQIQDLFKRPFRTRESSAKGKHKNQMIAESWQQARILDLPATLSALQVPRSLRFAVEISDPIEKFFNSSNSSSAFEKTFSGSGWKGVNGSWIVEFSPDGSSARPGTDSRLPQVSTSVNAFTRLIFGVSPASGLAITDEFKAPASLIEQLDKLLLLPEPNMDLDF